MVSAHHRRTEATPGSNLRSLLLILLAAIGVLSVALGEAPSASAAVVGPSAPTGVYSFVWEGSARVYWSGPVGATFVAQAYSGGAPVAGRSCATAASQCTISGLTDGQTYRFRVSAVAGARTSMPSAPSAPAVPGRWVPHAPTITKVEPKDASATISWSAAYEGIDMIVTKYEVQASSGGVPVPGRTCTTTGDAVSIAATRCTVGSLTNGSDYSFTVRVWEMPWFMVASRVSPSSAASTLVRPSTRPGAPSGVVAVNAGSGTGVLVSWNPSTVDGGAPITAYRAQAWAGGVLVPGAVCTSKVPEICKVVALTAGTEYTFTVSAVNIRGESVASAPSAPVVFTAIR